MLLYNSKIFDLKIYSSEVNNIRKLVTHSTLRGSGQKAELIGKLASKLASLSIREPRRVRSRLLRSVFIVKCIL